MQEQGGQPKGQRFKQTLLGVLNKKADNEERLQPFESELDVRSRLAAIARAGALVTYYLWQPSFSAQDVQDTRDAIIDQAVAVHSYMGKKSQRAITHQGFHLIQGIEDYGEQVQGMF